ncbi:hypothetical protein ADK74_14405 [Streptomyces decoyicus]|nr:hypothetical protein ADK74_14405 [Streptomyces decoyicus]
MRTGRDRRAERGRASASRREQPPAEGARSGAEGLAERGSGTSRGHRGDQVPLTSETMKIDKKPCGESELSDGRDWVAAR